MYSTDTEKARAFAEALHRGDTDKAGAPYIGHLERVAAGTDTDEAKVVAWLHDSMEDHPESVTFETLAGMFGEETAGAVRCMTHRAGETYDAYIDRVKTDPVARAVKISDLTDNSNLDRLPRITPADLERKEKYNRALRKLRD